MRGTGQFFVGGNWKCNGAQNAHTALPVCQCSDLLGVSRTGMTAHGVDAFLNTAVSSCLRSVSDLAHLDQRPSKAGTDDSVVLRQTWKSAFRKAVEYAFAWLSSYL